MRFSKLALALFTLSFGLTACGVGSLPMADPTPTPFSAPTQTANPPTPTPAPTPQPAVWLAGYLPASLREQITLPEGWQVAERSQEASWLQVLPENPSSLWVYALVAPFPTITNDVTLAELKSAWHNQADPRAPLLMDESTQGVFQAFWGEPGGGAVRIVPTDQLLDVAWQNPNSWAIIPFENIEPKWKVLKIDGVSPLMKSFDIATYPLTVPFGFSKEGFPIPPTNRDPEKLTEVAMTGVTALVRATADLMEKKGVLYPGGDVRDILRNADITHISNEVPFDPTCPRPNPASPALVFCSAVKYIDLLKDLNTDVVELTGDHFIDRGAEATLYTLDMYEKEGWQYYGGGRNLADALRPATFSDHGNKVAFVGCNAKGGGYATASDIYPGAGACGYDVLHQEIEKLKADGYVVIATFQHQEYYTYTVKPEYRPDFTGMVDAGASIVQGSQAHQPQNFEFYKDAFIHYGLGNLFFDQILERTNDGLPIDSAFIDLHYIYNGKYISTQLVPIKFIDFARPRPMTEEERVPFLEKLFKASGW